MRFFVFELENSSNDRDGSFGILHSIAWLVTLFERRLRRSDLSTGISIYNIREYISNIVKCQTRLMMVYYCCKRNHHLCRIAVSLKALPYNKIIDKKEEPG